MKRKRISEALEHLDPAYIDEAAGFTAVRLYQKPLFRLAAAAACLIICATAVLLTNVFDEQTPPVDTPPATTTATDKATSADTTIVMTSTTTTTTTVTATTTTVTTVATESSTAVITTTKRGAIQKGTQSIRTMTTTVTSTAENTTVTTTTARKGDDLPIPPRGTTTYQSSLPTKSTLGVNDTPTTTCDPSSSAATTSTTAKPARPNASFGEMAFRTDVRLQLDKQDYATDEMICLTIENTSADTLYLNRSFFWATQTEDGEWPRGWGSTPLSFTKSVLEPGETCTAKLSASYLSPDKTHAFACCVGDTWIRSDTFRVMPSSTTTVAEAITSATNAD